jgi:hypothetical protein
MKAHAALLSVAVSFALSGVLAAASTPVSPRSDTWKTFNLPTDLHNASPRALSVLSAAIARYRYPMGDEKGLLLTCVAPELDTNNETDVFKNCILAPGRTFDDVVHSFVQGIHAEQRQRMKEHSASKKGSDKNVDGKSALK